MAYFCAPQTERVCIQEFDRIDIHAQDGPSTAKYPFVKWYLHSYSFLQGHLSQYHEILICCQIESYYGFRRVSIVL